jgi:hypothetical protein
MGDILESFFDSRVGDLNSHPAMPKAALWTRSPPTAGALADYFIDPANLISVHLPTCQGGARSVSRRSTPLPPYDIYF